MSIPRRTILKLAAAAPAAALLTRISPAHAGTTLKISHQFPGGSIDQGDFRDRLCRKFAAEVTKATGGELEFQIYPGSSMMKTNAQFSALRKGALDLSLFPISYAGGEVKELNIGLMPALVSSYEEGARWKTAKVGQELSRILSEKGVVIISWVWQAGGLASRGDPIVDPEDAKGKKIRGGSREMDLMLNKAGAAVVTLPSSEIYVAMQTGAIDAALTSSTSLISFRLEEVSKSLTAGRGKSYWFMLEPLIMSKIVFDGLPKNQQDAIMTAGAAMESFGTQAAQADDEEVIAVYKKAGAKISDMSESTIEKWRTIAAESAWKDYAEKSESCANLLKLAEAV
jgi:TRAP-type C4-dicarboxylate transport system substrate-binding protein